MMSMQLLKRYPVTILVALVAGLAWVSPGLSGWLELDFGLVRSGQWWRIWTGHLTHYDGNHLFWDLLMFVVLGAVCEDVHRHRFAIGMTIMMAGIAGVVAFWSSDVHLYRGLSGIDTGLFVWFVSDQFVRCWRQKDRRTAMAWFASVAGLLGKLGYEATTGQTLFVDSANFTPLVESHLAGAALGLLCAITNAKRGHATNNESRYDRPLWGRSVKYDRALSDGMTSNLNGAKRLHHGQS
jgi:rhomboid family GlyGly-CTERM serine protease